MKRVVILLFFVVVAASRVFGTGEPSTHFNIYVPPNNESVQRHVSVIVTAIYDSTQFTIIDDDMDGDSDDSHSGYLMAGQSYVLYIKDNGVNDDANSAASGEQKADGDYFIIDSDKLVYASQSTNSDWQHDWVPATNKSSKGQRFIVYAPPTSFSKRDVNVFAYEDQTTVTVRKISNYSTLTTGYTDVDIANKSNIVIQRTLDIGEDIIHLFSDGQNIMEPGHTYVIESNKDITTQYGALYENARDGGGYVPSSTGGAAGDLFYFAVPYQADTEQEIRIISLDDTNDISLERYDNGNWIALKSWTLDTRDAAEWVGKREGNATYPTTFRVTCSSGKKVSVLEANWMETGSPGTSDMATMASSMTGKSAGKEFLVYMAPPGNEYNATDPFTGSKLSAGTHAYLFAYNKPTTVRVRDANTFGSVIDRTYTIESGRYADCNLDLNQWKSIYNGDGNPSTGDERPYLVIESDQNISVLVTNFNDNWMNYFGSSLEQSFTQSSSSSNAIGLPGDTVQVSTTISNESDFNIEDATVEVIVPDGLSPISTTITDESTGTTYDGTFTENTTTGENVGEFSTLTTLSANTDYTVTTDAVVNVKYENGDFVDENTVLSVETITSGTVDGTYQESSSSSGVSIETSNTLNMVFEEVLSSPWTNTISDSWTSNWIDYDNDNDLDLFVPAYSRGQASKLYRNIGNGAFEEVNIANLGLVEASSVASSWADYDNDGDLDVVIANNRGAKSELFINNGSGNFQRVNNALSGTDGYDHGVSWVDINNDGQLDLYTLDFMTVNFNTIYVADDGDFVQNGGSLLASENKRSIGASWADFDNDGLQDVFVPNGTPDASGDFNALYRNVGNGRFEKVTTGSIATDKYNSVASAWGDYNNDGFMDLFIANASNTVNQLYKNNGDGTFTKQNNAPFNQNKGNSHGCSWLDYDNDGDLDLLVVNNGDQASFLYRNNGDETFTPIEYENIAGKINNAMGTSVADMDKDGDLDVFVTTHGSANNHLFENKGNANSWVSVKLIGTISNQSAVGASVKIKAGGQWQMRQVSSQSGFGGQNSLNQHFGLASANTIDSVVVSWPSGITQYFTGEDVNQELAIVESTLSEVSGYVYNDINSNCTFDSNEKPLSNVEVVVGEHVAYTDNMGKYTFHLDLGTYVVSIESDKWNSNCTNPSVNVVEIGSAYTNNNIGVEASNLHIDRSVTLGTTALRRGFKNALVVSMENNGTKAVVNDTLFVSFNEHVMPLSASTDWDGQIGDSDTYYWVIDTLEAGTSTFIEITDSVSVTAPLEEEVILSATFTARTDYNTSDDQFTLVENIVGAVDPNDLLAFPRGLGQNRVIANSQVITYKIRFQNTGNYYAQNVVVTDYIPFSLDMNSFNMVSSSHMCDLSIDERTITWTFKNIMLPDSARDMEGSNGYIVFTITPSPLNVSGTTIFNKADIIFDYEQPIETNVVAHSVVSGALSNQGDVRIFPNPMTEHAMISLLPSDYDYEMNRNISGIQITDLSGRPLMQMSTEGVEVLLERGTLTSGMYIIKVINEDGEAFVSRLIVE